MRSQNKLRREDYTVGWVCALPIELAAAKAMLDEKHDDFTFETRTKDENIYCMGSVAGHNVVIVCLPAGHIGTNPAAHVATQLQAAFKGLRFGLMVGIGGGVPSAEADIRLGDVVVSQPQQTFGGVVQYDFGKATPSGFQRTSMLSFPPQILLSAVNTVRANLFLGQSGLRQHVARLESFDNFQRRKAGADVLFEPAYDHPNGHSTCSKCDVNEQRSRDPREAEAEICVHYGTIASGNRVIKNASERDKVSEELGGVYCFEMEAAGLMNSFPCLVIRGICDYADSHKNKAWQPYAAGTAAAYAKELLSAIPAADVEQTCRAEEFMRADESQCSGLSVSSKRIRANNSAEDNMQCESQARGGKNLSHQQNQRLAAQTQIGAGKPRAAPNSRLPNQLPPTMPNRNLYMATDGSRESRADMALKRSQNRSILDSMRAETNHYRAQVVELQAALGREKEIVERTMQSANKMQSTMDNRELFLGEQANDDVVMAMFGKLMSDIKTWSTRFNAGDADAFSEERLQDYRRVAPQYTEVSQLGNISARKRQKRLFVRGWTAYVMCTKLFRSLNLAPLGGLGEDVWIRKELSESFSCLENELWLIDRSVVSYKSFNDWRALTAELLGKAASIYDEDTAEQTRVLIWEAVLEVMEVVKSWHKTGEPEDLKVDEDKLHHIFDGAVQFARLLRRQRALWSIRFPVASPSSALRFNPTCMENERDEDEVNVEELKKCSVELVATPALHKRGTLNGESFDKEEAVCKAVVVLAGND